ncbi:hypothetical protein, partial [Methanosarcina sp.]|uniref:hypothetical protein n=1 Tax=Methanosarcina sp. TaxID=2213 RepID=UPI003BB5D3C5
MTVNMETHNFRIEKGNTFVAKDECVSVELPGAGIDSEPITIYNSTVANKVLIYYMSGEIKKDVAELTVDSSLVFYPDALDNAWYTISRTDVPYSRMIGAALNCNEITVDIPLKGTLPPSILIVVRVFRGAAFSDVCNVIRTPTISNCIMDCIGATFSRDDYAIVSFAMEKDN